MTASTTSTAPAPRRRPASGVRRPLLAGVAAGALVLALAACSAPAGTGTADAATPAGETAAPADGAPQDGGGRTPGVSGEVAAVDGTTAQVQDGESQTAVSWSDATTITVTVDGSLDDVAVGSCVLAVTGALPGADDASEEAGDAAATRVVVSSPVDGACTAGFGGGAGPGGFGDGERPDGAPTDVPTDRPSDLPTDVPDGAPTDMPSGGPGDGAGASGGFGGFGGLTSGEVTAVDGTTITVSTTSPDGTSATEDVLVDHATAYAVEQDGTAADVVVGQCVTAQGETDDSGALAATTLAVSAPGDDGCTVAGRGGFPGGPGRGDDAGSAQEGGDDA